MPFSLQSPPAFLRERGQGGGTHLILDPMVSGEPHRPEPERARGRGTGARRAALPPPLAPSLHPGQRRRRPSRVTARGLPGAVVRRGHWPGAGLPRAQRREGGNGRRALPTAPPPRLTSGGWSRARAERGTHLKCGARRTDVGLLPIPAPRVPQWGLAGQPPPERAQVFHGRDPELWGRMPAAGEGQDRKALRGGEPSPWRCA